MLGVSSQQRQMAPTSRNIETGFRAGTDPQNRFRASPASFWCPKADQPAPGLRQAPPRWISGAARPTESSKSRLLNGPTSYQAHRNRQCCGGDCGADVPAFPNRGMRRFTARPALGRRMRVCTINLVIGINRRRHRGHRFEGGWLKRHDPAAAAGGTLTQTITSGTATSG